MATEIPNLPSSHQFREIKLQYAVGREGHCDGTSKKSHGYIINKRLMFKKFMSATLNLLTDLSDVALVSNPNILDLNFSGGTHDVFLAVG